ncbi:hypothetical protein ACSSVZ_003062 [Amorphus sp. MBR-141]|jgi:hypothetical protein
MMPRYFFDTHDGSWEATDENGQCFSGLEAARVEAVRALRDMAWDELERSDVSAMTVRVRDEDGQAVFVATLSLTAEAAGTAR